MVCAISVEVEEGERRYHMANHSDIQPALSTCLWQLCVVELVDGAERSEAEGREDPAAVA